MIQERKPIFISKEAHEFIKKKAESEGCFMGDVVDVLVGVKEFYPTKERKKAAPAPITT